MATKADHQSSEQPGERPAPRWLDEREQRVWRGYLSMHRLLMAHLNRTLMVGTGGRGTGMSDGDYSVLVSLSEADDGRLRAFELGRDMQWEKSRLSHQLTRMEGRGLVRREECPSDARGAFIVLTERGRAAIEAAAPRHVDEVRRYFIDALSAEQLDALAGIIDTVVTRLDDPGADPDCPTDCRG